MAPSITGHLRTKLGRQKHALLRTLDQLQRSIEDTSSLTLDNDALLDEQQYIIDCRTDVLKDLQRIDTTHQQFLALTQQSDEAHEEYIIYTSDPKFAYEPIMAEAKEILVHADQTIDNIRAEIHNRGMQIPDVEDNSTGQSISSRATFPLRTAPTATSTALPQILQEPIATIPPPASPTVTDLTSRQFVTSQKPHAQPNRHESQPTQQAFYPFITPQMPHTHTHGHESQPKQQSFPLFMTSQEAYTQAHGHELHPRQQATFFPSFQHPMPSIAQQIPSPFLQAALVGRINLPEFSGDIAKWPSFHDGFEALIAPADLSGGHKLALLTSCLKGDARELISGLSTIDRNFETAMTILKNHYSRPKLIRQALLSQLRSLPECDSTGKQLKHLYAKLNVLVHQLCPEGEDHNPELLVNVILSKLPSSLQVRLVKESQRRDLGVFDVLTTIADAVDDDRIEQLLKGNVGKTKPQEDPNNEKTQKTNKATTPKQQRQRTKPSPICPLCSGTHKAKDCTQYTTPSDRKTAVYQRHLCANCLKADHKVGDCPTVQSCYNCGGRHHTSICTKQKSNSQGPSPTQGHHVQDTHPAKKPQPKPAQTPAKTIQHTRTAVTNMVHNEENSNNSNIPDSIDHCTMHVSDAPRDMRAPLLCLNVELQSPTDPSLTTTVTAVFDTASTTTFLAEKVARQLQLPTSGPEDLNVYTFGSTTPTKRSTYRTSFSIRLQDGSSITISAKSTPVISTPITWLQLQEKTKCPTAVSSYPELLIGMDHILDLFFHKNFSIETNPDGTQRINTLLGTVFTTQNNVSPLPSQESAITMIQTEGESDDNLIKKLWDLETLGIQDSPIDDDDTRCYTMFRDTILFDHLEKRYYVRLPFQGDTAELPSNYSIAFRRLSANYRCLSQNPEHLIKYDAIFQEQLQTGIIEEVPNFSLFKSDHVHYLAHHGVVKETSTTTKLRCVFDGSAHPKDKDSLNDMLYKGPVILPDLLGLLLRSRIPAILLSADIEKAFHMVGLHEDDRDYTRLLWVKDLFRPPSIENTRIFRFRRVPFGLNVSPFLLAGTILHHLEQSPSEFSDSLRRNCYVDNVYHGVNSYEEACKTFHSLRSLFGKASMNLREFVSNNPEFNIYAQEHLAGVENPFHTKVLGIHWDTKEDLYHLSKVTTENDSKWTKRLILRHSAQYWDVLGMVSPVTIPMKRFVQQLWKHDFSWDTVIEDPDLLNEWNRLVKQASMIHSITIPRQVLPFPRESSKIELHIFTDASAIAYCASTYLISRGPDGRGESRFLLAKSRVSPSDDKAVSIPRLELLGVLLGAILASHAMKELDISVNEIHLWTDSTICLSWIQSNNSQPTFIRNRVKKIRELLPSSTFYHHIDGTMNPADVGSRGCSTEELRSHPLWWSGPSFLKDPSFMWPTQREPEPTETSLSSVLTLSIDQPICDETSVIDPDRFRSWSSCRRTLLQVLKFATKTNQRLRNKLGDTDRKLLSHCDTILFRTAQQEDPPTDHTIVQLNLTKHKDGLWKRHSRVQNTDSSSRERNLIYMPKSSQLTQLLVLDIHNRLQHAGIEHTLCEARQLVWIPHGRTVVRKAINKFCFLCRRQKARPYPLPNFPDYPLQRTTVPRHPFEHTGMDLAGPFFYKQDKEKAKYWILIITCFNTRCVYLDTVTDMSVKTLLSRIRRFVATHGPPSTLLCDNAKSFVALEEILRDIQTESNNDILDYCSSKSIDIRFTTPLSPWKGALYERLIALMKNSLRSTLGRKILPLEEITTIVTECAAIVNSRPQTYVSSSDESCVPLRPVDFLHPRADSALPRLSLEQENDSTTDPEWRQSPRDSLLQSWTQQNSLLNTFWYRWKTEYLANLLEHYKVKHRTPRSVSHQTPHKDSLVLVHEEGLERGQWKMARVISSPDNFQRTATLRTSSGGTITRPLSLLYDLELACDSDEPSPDTQVTAVENAHHMTTRSRAGKPILPSTTTALLLFCCLSISVIGVDTASSTKCSTSLSTRTKLLYTTTCQINGIAVSLLSEPSSKQRYCWFPIRCPSGDILSPAQLEAESNSNFCGPVCSCPSWTRSCNYYDGKMKNLFNKSTIPPMLRAYTPPQVCSFKDSSQCSSQARTGIFAQVQLYDDSILIVPELNIVKHDLYDSTDFRCISADTSISFDIPNEATTGTTIYCKLHNCSDVPNASFCFHGTPLVAYVYENIKIPIFAWGHTSISYYPFGKRESTDKDSTFMNISCSKGGLSIQKDSSIDTIEVCSKSSCQIYSKPTPPDFHVYLPSYIAMEQYEATVTGWITGHQHIQKILKCDAHPLCDTISCYWCITYLTSWNCWSIGEKFIGAIIILVVLITCVSLTTQILLTPIYALLRIISLLLIKIPYRLVCGTLLSVRQRYNKSRQSYATTTTVASRNPYSRKRIALTVTILCYLVPSTSSCAEIVSLDAKRTECTRQESIINCSMTDTTLLSLRPVGQPICLVIVEPQTSQTIGFISFMVDSISHTCQKETLYFTRDHKFNVDSHHVCGDIMNSGSCDDIECSSVHINDSLKFFTDETNSTPGFTTCSSSCGCISCGCTSCSPSCIFSRLHARPTSSNVYETFRCPSWISTIDVKMEINLKQHKEEKRLTLHPGVTTRGHDLSLTVISTSNQFLPILSYQYATDGRRTAIIESSPPGQYVPNSFGQLQCPTRSHAESFTCEFRPYVCSCTNTAYTQTCACPNGNIDYFFSDRYLLPIESQGLSLRPGDSTILAHTTTSSSLLLQVSMNDFKLRTIMDVNQCSVSTSDADGCLHCITGIKAEILCTSTISDEIGDITCLDPATNHSQIAVARCSPTGHITPIRLQAPSTSYELLCTIYCPGGSNEFRVKGTAQDVSFSSNPFNNIAGQTTSSSNRNFLVEIMTNIISFYSTVFWGIVIFLGSLIIIYVIISLRAPVSRR